MQRIMIIGSCGAGKSTLARRIQEITKLPLFHLDQYYWSSGWTEAPKDKWKKTVRQLASQPRWIIDGNYGGTMDIRLSNADTVLFLDYPTAKCMYRVLKRILQYRGKVRPDMVEGCPERFDWSFLHYVLTFNLTRRNGILKKLQKIEKFTKVYTFNNDRSTNQFLQSLKT
jgi:adenylate kinase family enzyme